MISVTHTITLKTTINEEKAPKDIVERLRKVDNEHLPSLLNVVFLATAQKLKLFESMNENNTYATVEPVLEKL